MDSRNAFLLAVVLALLALLVHAEEHKDNHQPASLQSAPTHESLSQVVGYLTVQCPGANCPQQQQQQAVAACPPLGCGGSVGNSEVRALSHEMNHLRRTLTRRLRRAMRSIKHLKKENKRLAKKEQKDHTDLSSQISVVAQQAAVGRPGPRGPRGDTGRTGPRGLPGAPGPAGVRGREGRKGSTGARGSPGQPGARGPAGPAGQRGAAGPQGPPGKTGANGRDGRNGKDGANGKNGSPGAPGRQGPPGRRGSQGPRGATGDSGKSVKGPAGPRGPPGPPGAPGQNGKSVVLKPRSLRHPPGEYVTLATRTTGLSWNDAQTMCQSNGMNLCRYDFLCYNGNHEENKFAMQGDVWIPYGGDGDNAWITVGTAHPFCKTHPQIDNGNRPGWGNTDNRGGHKGALYCCGGKPKISHDIKVMGYSYDMNWDDTEHLCEANGMELCNYLSICPQGGSGKPQLGLVLDTNGAGDSWSPVGGEDDNMWVQSGKAWPTCLRHTEIQGGAYGRPGWGNVRDRGVHHGPIYCCGKPDKQESHQMSIGTSDMSWDDVSGMCKLNEMNLCNYASLCPNGRGQPPIMGRKTVDDWIPMTDNQGAGTYVQIGQPWPQCYRHTEIPGGFSGGPYGRPGWQDRSHYPFKGEARCCGKKPDPRPMENIGTGRGKSWDQANAACQAKKKGLCRYTDICPNGPGSTPSMGTKGGDIWIPFSDAGPNSWIQIGGASWPVCHRHSEIANGIHGRPGWGVQSGGEGWHGDIFCC